VGLQEYSLFLKGLTMAHLLFFDISFLFADE